MKNINYLLFVFAITLFSCKSEDNKTTETKKEELVVVAERTIQKEESIYKKLGGEEGVSAIVEDIVAKHLENNKIQHYFIVLKENPEYFNQFKQHVKDFLGAGTGGGNEYKGRDMIGAHKGLNLSESDFLEALDDILYVLDDHKVDRASRNELLATLYSMKGAIIKQ